MSEQEDIWKARDSGLTRRCHKYGIRVTGCSLHYDCKDCKGPEREVKDAPKAGKTHRKRPRIQPHTEVIPVKKRARKPRIDTISGPKAKRSPKKVPKGKGNNRRPRTSSQQRLGDIR